MIARYEHNEIDNGIDSNREMNENKMIRAT